MKLKVLHQVSIWLNYILIILLALQSASALADVHQTHQTGEEHLEFEHDHDLNEGLHSENPSEEHGYEFDCHHCCHCHGGTTHFYLNGSLSAVFGPGATINITASPNLYYPPALVPDNPPPIA